LLAVLDKPWLDSLPQQLSGSLTNFDLVLDAGTGQRWLSGEIRALSLSDWPGLPSLGGLNGRVQLQSGEGNVWLNGPALQLDWPEMFGYPLQFSLPECQAELQLGTEWQLALQSCHLFNDDVSLQGDVRIVSNETRPSVDVNVDILRLDATRLNPYWPEGIMPKAVTDWLRANLKSGQLSSGRLQIFGDMDDWPFSLGEGRFEARAHIENGLLTFAPGWPALQQLNLSAEFIGAGMRVEGQAASFGGVTVEQATARIDSFGQPLLEVEFRSHDSAGKVVELLQQTPVLPAEDTDLSRFRFGGSVNAQGKLQIPLGKTPGELQLDGMAKLSKGSFEDMESGVRLDGVSGSLSFDQKHMWAENLPASFKDKPARLDLQVGGDEQWGLQAELGGEFDVRDLLPEYFLQQPEFIRHFYGSSDWLARVLVPARSDDLDQPVQITLESGLQGVSIDLPAPLAKEYFETWPFSLQYPLSGDKRVLQIELNQEFKLAAELDASQLTGDALPAVTRATVTLGEGASVLPQPGHIQIGGRAGRLDLGAWVDLAIDNAGDGGSLGGLQLDEFEVQAGELIFLDRAFAETALKVALVGQNIRGDFNAADINGHLQFTFGTTGSNSLNAEFERLALGKPISSGMDTNSNPAELPELHLYARSFRYAGLEMGETRIEGYPTATGFHFEKVEADSKALSIRASGDWSLQESSQRSEFDIMMTAESLGDLLHSLDISSSLVGGQTVLEFDAWWPGSPAAFALARLNGEIEFSVTRGQITNANTGTGKVLGLLSIQSLPRRLALDFRDVFDSGFVFETASGTFQMENGTATTDDVKLTSSAANISLSGSTNLVKQQYHQQMTVMPGVGNTLPVIGAIAAGPGGAAAGLALQGLLHEQLGKATQVHYTITGSWDDPVIEPVIKDAGNETGNEPVSEAGNEASGELEDGNGEVSVDGIGENAGQDEDGGSKDSLVQRNN
ncbi:MAG TPA: YhdP family protein, partial [Xanthomonadales bacterium]|nr:YhdP family protein [Xanthomonadales bacterium]